MLLLLVLIARLGEDKRGYGRDYGEQSLISATGQIQKRYAATTMPITNLSNANNLPVLLNAL